MTSEVKIGKRPRPGRTFWFRDLRLWAFDWGFAVQRGLLRDLFVRVWPHPYVIVIVTTHGTQVTLSPNFGGIVRVRDAEIEAVRTMWGSWR